MEMQYAIFCANVKFPNKPQGAVVLTKPISGITTQNISDIAFPLFVTFINCTLGRHNFEIKISDISGKINTTRDFQFECNRISLSHAECFSVEFPIHNTDLLTFSMILDDIPQNDIKLPIKVEI